MYEDFNRNKINMIGACLILYYDINDEKAAKRNTIANSNINEKSKSALSNTNFSIIYSFIFWQGIKQSSFKHNITLLNVQDNIWYKDKFKIANKFIFFHLIYRSFKSKEHVKCMLFIFVLILLMYVGKLNRYGINYFVLFLYKCIIDTV